MSKMEINYYQIYMDLITKKYPEKKEEILPLLKDKKLSALDVIKINKRLFGSSNNMNGKYRSYIESDIVKILDYQIKNKLNNTQLAKHFNLSRNTVSKWKKIFQYK
ncbi:helix-turn-helix domain-containing protein [Empedobacter brevis]|uniref:helix-turn-helix domain-containing protein n=1 Tax=Empedobacter brevis TaxID=247 RepID=UPI002898F48F|nr:helix-turn-helix domain-containing protein [Empedobacter brevis]